MQWINREQYLNKLIAFKDKKMIKVITGIRRCGKSTLMEIYQDYLRQHGVEDKQMIVVNLEDFDFYELRDKAMLHTYIKERLLPNKQMYIFIDEVQQCLDFPIVVDSLFLKKKCRYIFNRFKCLYVIE